VLVLLAAAFAAGWIARGRPELGRSGGASDPGGTSRPPPAAPARDALIAEADEVVRRALTAARAALAVASGPAGTSDAAVRASVTVLDQRLTELEDMADRLEDARGPDDRAFLAFDRVVSSLATLRRRPDSPA